jgi:hypothetical protein
MLCDYKRDLGLASCQARIEYAHFAHVEMLFFAETLILLQSPAITRNRPQ